MRALGLLRILVGGLVVLWVALFVAGAIGR
jgi:hypothetical protein